MAYSKRVAVAVTPRELAALNWVARRDMLQRYPNSKAPKRPGAGAVLRRMSVTQAVEEYEKAKAEERTGVVQTP
jgi:hypothetical protein